MEEIYQNEEILLNDFQLGKELAIHHLFDKYYPSLRYFAAGIVDNGQEAEDIAITVFQKLLETRSGFSSIIAIRSFLFTAAKNAAIDYLRKERTRQKNAAEIGYLLFPAEEMEEQKMLEAKVLQLIYEEMERLPPQCSAIFKAYFFDGKDTASIAREMNLSTQTVLNHKARAVHQLRAFVKKQGIFPVVCLILPGLFK